MDKPTIYISYSHKDREWLDKLLIHLRPLSDSFNIWVDSFITPGANWKNEIKQTIENSQIAILLVSADYLASDYIKQNEIPTIQFAAENKGMIVLPIAIEPYSIKNKELNKYQFLNSPYKSLLTLNQYEQEKLLVGLANTIKSIDIKTNDEKITRDIRLEPEGSKKLADEVAKKVIEMMNSKTKFDSDQKNSQSKLVFVIISFNEEMEPIYEGIAEAAEKVGLIAKRVKDVPGDYQITNKILQMINTARIIVADLTNERPNVYFELGYARGLSKSIITIARRDTKIHFDVQGWTYLPYNDSRVLEKELIERFKYELEK